MKKTITKLLLLVAIGLTSTVCTSCDKGGNEPGNGGNETGNGNTENPFVGTWVQESSNGTVTVLLTETTWTAKSNSSIYNSGTYIYDGNTAILKITDKGMGSANAGETGSATIANNTMTVSSFSDENMNGQYTKQNGNGNGNVENPTATTDPGIIINGVKWATRNVDTVGTFAATSESTGKFYQWNRKKAWSATEPAEGIPIDNWDNSNATGLEWIKANDPSPVGWRVPSESDFEKLLDENKVNIVWSESKKGYTFTDKVTGNSIFLLAAGNRYNGDGRLDGLNGLGHYWSRTGGTESAVELSFYIDYRIGFYDFMKAGAFPIRSVAE